GRIGPFESPRSDRRQGGGSAGYWIGVMITHVARDTTGERLKVWWQLVALAGAAARRRRTHRPGRGAASYWPGAWSLGPDQVTIADPVRPKEDPAVARQPLGDVAIGKPPETAVAPVRPPGGTNPQRAPLGRDAEPVVVTDTNEC